MYEIESYWLFIKDEFSNATFNIRVGLWEKVKQRRGKCYYVIIKYDGIVRKKQNEVACE